MEYIQHLLTPYDRDAHLSIPHQSPVRRLYVARLYRYQDVPCTADCGVWSTVCSAAQHTRTISVITNRSNSINRYNVLYSAATSITQSFWYLIYGSEWNSSAKYWGAKCIVAPTKLFGSTALLPPIAPHQRSQRLYDNWHRDQETDNHHGETC